MIKVTKEYAKVLQRQPKGTRMCVIDVPKGNWTNYLNEIGLQLGYAHGVFQAGNLEDGADPVVVVELLNGQLIESGTKAVTYIDTSLNNAKSNHIPLLTQYFVEEVE